MVVVMAAEAGETEVDGVVDRVRAAGADAFVSRGMSRTIVGLVGDVDQLDTLNLRGMPGVSDVVRITVPYMLLAVVETFDPGGSSMNGMNLSGKPGIVQPMQIPPTFGQPPTPLVQPRLGTLHLTTGPQQPSFTMHLGEPYSSAKSPCS